MSLHNVDAYAPSAPNNDRSLSGTFFLCQIHIVPTLEEVARNVVLGSPRSICIPSSGRKVVS